MSIRNFVMISMLSLCALSLTGHVMAQQSQGVPEPVEESSQGEPAETPVQPADMPDIDNQPIERPAGQSPGRFIPSEQISQDLGVSFPVDI
jgi:hypothetical protein